MAGSLDLVDLPILQYLMAAGEGIDMGWIVINYGLFHKVAVPAVSLSCLAILLVTGCSQHRVNSDVARLDRAIPYSIVASDMPAAKLSAASNYNWASCSNG